MRQTLASPDRDRDRRRGPRCERPALLRQRRRPQADRRPAADVAEAVVGAEAAVVVAAGDEDGAPAAGRLLERLDRDELAAARDRRSAAAHLAMEDHRLPGAELPGG